VYRVLNHNNKVPRPVRFTDFVVIFTGALYNLFQVFEVFFSEIHELSIYHSNQKTKTMQAWEDMSTDLEKLQGDTDG
jgi:hypothetical protein